MMWVNHLEQTQSYEYIGFPGKCSPQRHPLTEEAFEKQVGKKTSTDVSFPSYRSACSK